MLNPAMMIIACPACATRYTVADDAIGHTGRTVRCAQCRHSWFQEPFEALEGDEEPAEEAVLAGAEAGREHEGRLAAADEPRAAQGDDPPADWAASADQAADQAAEPDRWAESDSNGDHAFLSAEAVEARTGEDHAMQGAEAQRIALPPKDFAPAPVASAEAMPRDSETAEFARVDDDTPPAERTSPSRRWLVAAGVFTALVAAMVGAAAAWGVPDWLPWSRPTFAAEQPDLVLKFPPERQDRRMLANGSEFFGASGSVTNIGQQTRRLPPILIVLRDDRERIVYSWEVTPPKPALAPGESVTINEAVTDVPASARVAEIGWKPG